MKPETLDILVALSDTGEPPSEFRLFSKGDVRTRKGAFLFDDAAAASVMKHAREFGAEYPLDYGHAMLGGGMLGHADPAEGHKAAGWFRPVLREGELWATDVTWTPTATRKLKDREYRYVSPAFHAEDVTLDARTKARRVTELINVALTNVPATKGLKPLMASVTQDDADIPSADGEDMKTIAIALGLSGDASESDVLARLSLYRDVLGELGKLTGKDSPKEALAVTMAWQEKAGRVDELSTKVAKLDGEVRLQKVQKQVDAKIDAKRLTPAKREFAIKLGMRDEEMFEAFLAECNTPIVSGPDEQPTPAVVDRTGRGLETPSAEFLSMAGISKEAFLKSQKELADKGVI